MITQCIQLLKPCHELFLRYITIKNAFTSEQTLLKTKISANYPNRGCQGSDSCTTHTETGVVFCSVQREQLVLRANYGRLVVGQSTFIPFMIENLLDQAYKHCITHGYRFTDPRALVLKILAEEAKPLGAYDILQKLSNAIDKPKPPTVYRAIQFWHQEGFVHCIDSLKSYVVCSNGHHIGQTQFLICSHCGFVKELENIIDFTPVTESAQSMQFSIRTCTVEIKGLCINCKKN